MPNTIYIGADHGGFALKEKLREFLSQQNFTVVDCGASSYDASDDYPKYALAVAQQVKADPNSLGVLICRSAGGMVVAANKVPGVRAIAVGSVQEAELARSKNDATVAVLGADFITSEPEIKQVVLTFLNTDFSQAERHVRRLDAIAAYEKSR